MTRLLFLALLFNLPLYAGGKLNVDSQSLALHGYDPVAYSRLGKALPGRPHLDANYGKARFLFATDKNRQAFQKTPLAFLPAYGGWCAYAMAEGDYVDVDPSTFKNVSGTTHLFYNGWLGNTLKKWNKDEIHLKAAADSHWKNMTETLLP